MKYGNDIHLTAISRQFHNEEAEFQAMLRDGHLDSAFTQARQMQLTLDDVMARLNQLKYNNNELLGQTAR